MKHKGKYFVSIDIPFSPATDYLFLTQRSYKNYFESEKECDKFIKKVKETSNLAGDMIFKKGKVK